MKGMLGVYWMACVGVIVLLPAQSVARDIPSEPDEAKRSWNMAQLTQCFWVSKELKVMVFDGGGATDASPTKDVFLSVHRVGEVGSTYANFHLGTYFKVISAEKEASAPGSVVIRLLVEDPFNAAMPFKAYRVDVTQALQDVEKAHAWDSSEPDRNGDSVNVKTMITLLDVGE